MQLTSGQILMYNMKTRKMLHQTEVAHTSQIQRCRVSNVNPMQMGSVSFDGTLRVWDLRSNSLKLIIEDRAAVDKDKIL